MHQTRLYFACSAREAAALSDAVEAEFELDGWPVAAFEVDEDAGLWNVSVYAPQDQAQEARRRLALHSGGREVDAEEFGEVDWVAHTLSELSPVRAGRFVVHGSHDRHVPRPHEIGLLIDAGLAFGTGHHGTTAGCLAMFDRVAKARRFFNVLDLGTGSGVLAIAAARAQPLRALASDIDPVAVAVARDNAKLNRAAARVECITAMGFGHQRFAQRRPFDLVFANILARPLELLARDLARHCAPGAVVILSGLLPHQQSRIVAAYRIQGLRLVRAHRQDGWLTLVMEKA